jgi:hypothetical protein
MITKWHRVWARLISPRGVATIFKVIFALVGCYATSMGSWFRYCPETSVTTNIRCIKPHTSKDLTAVAET